MDRGQRVIERQGYKKNSIIEDRYIHIYVYKRTRITIWIMEYQVGYSIAISRHRSFFYARRTDNDRGKYYIYTRAVEIEMKTTAVGGVNDKIK